MRASAIHFFIAALASAAPAPAKRQTTLTSKGFTLVAKVTDATKDLSPSVDNSVLIAAHIGAGFNMAVLYPPGTTDGNVFYENGTATEVAAGTTGIINDQARPLTPFGVSIQSPTEFDVTYPTEHSIFINAGTGTRVSVSGSPVPILRNYQDTSAKGTFAACNNTVPYYRRKFITLQYVYGGEIVPEECAPVVLIPQCAELADLPADAYASHEFAVDLPCFEDVAKVKLS